MSPEIRELSKSMINKIAAGEVVERPANVVKELVENSIDAGATRVDISVGKSGSESIKIVDDGCGIAANQLILALSPHSTSKISEADDLFRIHTLGFRGEALASIAEVGQLTLRSRTADSPEGAQIRVDGGVFEEVAPCGGPIGTTIEVCNLFFNVPARRKFLKSPTTEFGHISEAVVRVALPRLGVRFVLNHNGRVVYDFPSTGDMRSRIGKIFGSDVAERLLPIESAYKNVKVSGFAGLPDLSRGTPSLQYLFLNGRYVRDRALQHALAEAYRGLLVSGRYPVAFLNIETPPDFVDVNVHPSKLEVRFVDGQAIYAGVLSAIRDRFLRSDLTSRPNGAELAAAAKRSQSESPKGVDVPPRDVSRRDVSQRDEPPREKPVVERRFVPDVDVRDPVAALDPGVARERRTDILGWLNVKRSATGGASASVESAGDAESAESAGSVKSDEADAGSAKTAPDFAAANAAFDEAALETNAEHRVSESPRPCASSRFAGSKDSSEFRKFPPLPSSSFAPGTFGGVFEAPRKSISSEAPQAAAGNSTNPDSPQLETPSRRAERLNLAPISETDGKFSPTENAGGLLETAPSTGENARAAADLRDRVAANNAGWSGGRFAGRVAFDSNGKPVVQLGDRYLAMEAPNGLALVDQHALHERILFEKLKTDLESGKLDSQRLLVPEVVDLAPTELPFALENKRLFADLGILVDAFGGASVVINGYPAILRKAPPTEIFFAALDALRENRGRLERADLLDASLKQMACKAAIKAGDPLRGDEIFELIAAAETELNSHHCPHGRPSTLVFSYQEIDKLFKRQ